MVSRAAWSSATRIVVHARSVPSPKPRRTCSARAMVASSAAGVRAEPGMMASANASAERSVEGESVGEAGETL